MSRGPGKIERGILALLGLAPNHSLSRRSLELALVEHQGHDPSAVLRAIRSLERDYLVRLHEDPDKRRAYVELLRAKLVSDEYALGLLSELGLARSQQADTAWQGYSKPAVRRADRSGGGSG